ncbi:hypothetical protein IE53DRAFT_366627 [Violaceomyces palustris]|uniref:Uncharacterized protein n=1 Tax=Violaceomyces palustris TaxID=1673888 RepID=A0ACD0P4X5_9BASI|nr:hypothetical protein IE53DRAFT_366627 [Violaceomyces palustris]
MFSRIYDEPASTLPSSSIHHPVAAPNGIVLYGIMASVVLPTHPAIQSLAQQVTTLVVTSHFRVESGQDSVYAGEITNLFGKMFQTLGRDPMTSQLWLWLHALLRTERRWIDCKKQIFRMMEAQGAKSRADPVLTSVARDWEQELKSLRSVTRFTFAFLKLTRDSRAPSPYKAQQAVPPPAYCGCSAHTKLVDERGSSFVSFMGEEYFLDEEVSEHASSAPTSPGWGERQLPPEWGPSTGCDQSGVFSELEADGFQEDSRSLFTSSWYQDCIEDEDLVGCASGGHDGPHPLGSHSRSSSSSLLPQVIECTPGGSGMGHDAALKTEATRSPCSIKRGFNDLFRGTQLTAVDRESFYPDDGFGNALPQSFEKGKSGRSRDLNGQESFSSSSSGEPQITHGCTEGYSKRVETKPSFSSIASSSSSVLSLDLFLGSPCQSPVTAKPKSSGQGSSERLHSPVRVLKRMSSTDSLSSTCEGQGLKPSIVVGARSNRRFSPSNLSCNMRLEETSTPLRKPSLSISVPSEPAAVAEEEEARPPTFEEVQNEIRDDPRLGLGSDSSSSFGGKGKSATPPLRSEVRMQGRGASSDHHFEEWLSVPTPKTFYLGHEVERNSWSLDRGTGPFSSSTFPQMDEICYAAQ